MTRMTVREAVRNRSMGGLASEMNLWLLGARSKGECKPQKTVTAGDHKVTILVTECEALISQKYRSRNIE